MNNRTVLISGASTGIGEACALHLDQLGFRVFAGVRREVDGQVLQEQASGRLQTLYLDVTEADSVAAAVKEIGQQVAEAGLYGLVNNAGIVVAAPLEFLPIADLQWQLEVNVVGQLRVIQAFLPMVRQARGRIVNMSSTSGRMAAPFLGPYAASKFALEALSDSLRVELRPWGISVSLVEPGAIATPIWDKSLAAVNERLRAMPPEADRLYGRLYPKIRRLAATSGKYAAPPILVARAVAHALMARQPKARYLLPWRSALMSRLARLTPVRLRDAVIAWALGIK